MGELQQEQNKDSTYVESALSPNLHRDFDLAFEEEHAKLKSDFATLQKKHADYITRFDELQMKNGDLHDRNESIEQKLRALEKASSSSNQTEFIIKDQRKTIEELESIIERHENENELNRVTKEQMSKELNSLRRSADRLVQLDDEVKMLRNDNGSLVKKANMVDHFQRKLEMQSNMERENAKLREQIDVLEENQKDYDQVHADIEKHRKELKENMSTLAHHEVQIFEYQQQNRTLKDELRSCENKIIELSSKGVRDEEFIKDLQEQLNSSATIPFSPTTPTAEAGTMLSLEQELEQSEDPLRILRLENARLKAENQVLKSGSAGSANADLRDDLEKSESFRKRIEQNLQSLTARHAIDEEQLEALGSSSLDDK
jgi:protein HOOK3